MHALSPGFLPQHHGSDDQPLAARGRTPLDGPRPAPPVLRAMRALHAARTTRCLPAGLVRYRRAGCLHDVCGWARLLVDNVAGFRLPVGYLQRSRFRPRVSVLPRWPSVPFVGLDLSGAVACQPVRALPGCNYPRIKKARPIPFAGVLFYWRCYDVTPGALRVLAVPTRVRTRQSRAEQDSIRPQERPGARRAPPAMRAQLPQL